MPGSLEDRMPAYLVATREGVYRVVDADGRSVLDCADEHSAAHYAALMNRAFGAGYRSGYRDARDG